MLFCSCRSSADTTITANAQDAPIASTSQGASRSREAAREKHPPNMGDDERVRKAASPARGNDASAARETDTAMSQLVEQLSVADIASQRQVVPRGMGVLNNANRRPQSCPQIADSLETDFWGLQAKRARKARLAQRKADQRLRRVDRSTEDDSGRLDPSCSTGQSAESATSTEASPATVVVTEDRDGRATACDMQTQQTDGTSPRELEEDRQQSQDGEAQAGKYG